MKIDLPNGQKIILEENLSMEEKLKVVKELLNEHYPMIEKSDWETNRVKFFLSGLGDYIVWHKEENQKNKTDKEVLSIKKTKQMSGKIKSPSIPFSSLGKLDREILGLGGDDE
ncbi:hypothetical protein IEN91_04715 [Bacillus velezensis]|uniref:hypothetical protein n=1 Tax=Bacillus velezensis TaxID=492670 RepID=UPI0018C70EB4|nr:hypothetical protein [Bacillus velezensis]QPK89746.1 hypothetical protein IEN91_04715 [Bacillus velezensis]